MHIYIYICIYIRYIYIYIYGSLQIFNSGAPSSPWTCLSVPCFFALVPPHPSGTSGRTRGRTRRRLVCALVFAAASRYWLAIASSS